MAGELEAAAAPARVLVVDDEETVRNLLSLVVGRVGAKADLAESGARARALLAERDYACAILDKNLPDSSGLELLELIREQHPRTEVLIITGYANMQSAIEALRLGAMDYIVKPFEVIAVQQRVTLAVERRRLRDERERLVDDLRAAHARLAESRQELQRAYLESVLSLSKVAEHGDSGAEGHLRRISRYAALLARTLEATDQWVETIGYAAPLHDVGMIAVPGEIVRRAGPITAAERQTLAGHVAAGARILEGGTSDVLAMGREIVLSHHERWDGAGYPAALRGDTIPLAGRIVAVADAWDAMTTDRCYRKALGIEAAIEELRRAAGTQLDAAMVTAFLDELPRVRAVLEG